MIECLSDARDHSPPVRYVQAPPVRRALLFLLTACKVKDAPPIKEPYADKFERADIGGGYLAEFQRQRRRKRRNDKDKTPSSLPAEAQAGPGSADATPPAPAADLELVRSLVAYWTGEADREQLNRRAQRALDYALRAQTVLAMQLFERELARQMEDDDMSALLMILADD